MSTPPIQWRPAFFAGLAMLGTAHAESMEVCVSRGPTYEADGPTYEVVDIGRKVVWATRDWTPEAFEAFRLPLQKLTWRKNDPRERLDDDVQLLRSPGCEQDGQYTYLQAFGREFLHTVEFDRVDRSLARSHEFVSVRLETHNTARFSAGQSVPVLLDPDGDLFLAVSRSADPDKEGALKLPPDWRHEVRTLSEDYEISYSGLVTAIRASNGHAYQGPIPADALPAGWDAAE